MLSYTATDKFSATLEYTHSEMILKGGCCQSVGIGQYSGMGLSFTVRSGIILLVNTNNNHQIKGIMLIMNTNNNHQLKGIILIMNTNNNHQLKGIMLIMNTNNNHQLKGIMLIMNTNNNHQLKWYDITYEYMHPEKINM